MIVKVKGSYEVIRQFCLEITELTNLMLQNAKQIEDFKKRKDAFHEHLSQLMRYLTEDFVPGKHFLLYPADEDDEELIGEINEDRSFDLFTQIALYELASDIFDRMESKKLAELAA